MSDVKEDIFCHILIVIIIQLTVMHIHEENQQNEIKTIVASTIKIKPLMK